jgi:predicted phage baseplate assembly protein
MNPVNPAVCADDSYRRAALHLSTTLTGLDYLEVDEHDRHLLHVVFIGRLPAGLADSLSAANFVITGGRRTRNLKVVHIEMCDPVDQELDDCVTLTVDRIGDFSTYTVCVVEADHGHPTDRPHPAFDPRYRCLDFTFTAGCPSGADCAEPQVCPPELKPKPPIDYLAKDYASFRQLMLDRLAVLIPGWTEKHVPDLMLSLVELAAYEGDRLSYLQDAVATEAYLNTARQRISVRRHTRLVDYFLHEGSNSRAWVYVEAVGSDSSAYHLDDFFFTTAVPGLAAGLTLSMQDLTNVPPDAYEVFEPLMEPQTVQFNRRGLLDPTGLCNRLLDPQDPAARLLRDRLRPYAREALDDWNGVGAPPQHLVDAILAELNRLTREQSLYDEKAFEKHRHSHKTRRLLQHPTGGHAVQINRSVIEEEFQDVFVQAGQVRFFKAHNTIHFYTWGEENCCLPKGATSASLLDECLDVEVVGAQTPGQKAPSEEQSAISYSAAASSRNAYAQSSKAPKARPRPRKHHRISRARCLSLQPGDYLLFEEVKGPHTNNPADADPAHRHVVRLTRVEQVTDPLLGFAVLEVEWAPEDALPFPVCISATGPAPDCELIINISVARGNILLVDHGRRVIDELNPVEVVEIVEPCEDDCRPEAQLTPAPYHPVLTHRDLTHAVPLLPGVPAATQFAADPHKALPAIRLEQIPLAPPCIESPDPLARYRAPLLLTSFDAQEDVLSAAPLAKELKAAAKNSPPLVAYFVARLDVETQKDLAAYDPTGPLPDKLAGELLGLLNDALSDIDLYTPDRFPRDLLDDATLALQAERPLPADLERLFNRWLLEQALPDVLAPARRYVAAWTARPDLLEATGDEPVFVVEMTDDRRALLRFGDDDLGEMPEAVSRFRAFYRVGSGTRGNVGAEAICHFGLRIGVAQDNLRPRNPLAARGGVEPEPLDSARLRAPYAIRGDLQRTVTAEDYAALAARDFTAELQGAAAQLVWTGSWYTARVSLDPIGSEEAKHKLLDSVTLDLEKYRRIGHELVVAQALYVPLTIGIRVCVKAGYQTAHVLSNLREIFGSRTVSQGGNAFFHPDNLRFGSGVAVSRLVAAAQAAPGVLWAQVTQLERLGEGDQGELDAGYLPIGPTEIARCDNDAGFPEFGSIAFDMGGGR